MIKFHKAPMVKFLDTAIILKKLEKLMQLKLEIQLDINKILKMKLQCLSRFQIYNSNLKKELLHIMVIN